MKKQLSDIERNQTVRRSIIELISEQELSAREISAAIGIREKEVFDHLEHIEKSLQARKQKLVITPAQCLSCDYVFTDRRRLSKPGRCPQCKHEHLADPLYRIL
ncbi:MAG: transcriptional regulator [bacterium]|nr:transcriptional regulator [bacterium]